MLALVIIAVVALYYVMSNKKVSTVDQSDNGLVAQTDPVNQNQNATQAPIVGGDKDTHGCIGSAGYVWDANQKVCVRPWEKVISSVANGKEYKTEDGKLALSITQDSASNYFLSAKACNSASGTVTFDSKTSTVKGGPFAMTMMACADNSLMELDTNFASMIEKGAVLTLQGNDSFTLAGSRKSFTFVKK